MENFSFYILLIVFGAVIGVILLAAVIGSIFRGLPVRGYPGGYHYDRGGFSGALIIFSVIIILVYWKQSDRAGPPGQLPLDKMDAPLQSVQTNRNHHEVEEAPGQNGSEIGDLERAVRQRIQSKRQNVWKPHPQLKSKKWFSIQVGAFTEMKNARKFHRKCQNQTHEVVNIHEDDGQFKVMVGHFYERAEALVAEQALERQGIKGHLRVIHVSPNPP